RGKSLRQKSVTVGLHPAGMALSPTGRFLYVANANSDTVSVLDTAELKVIDTIDCRPEGRLPFGSGCNALAISADGSTIYLSDGTNNCVAVVQLGDKIRDSSAKRPATTKLLGLIPAGWYPGAILLSPDGKTLYVANIKGHGSLNKPLAIEAQKGMNSH